ncbi:MAG: ABC transporter ATP-binding protein [Tissierellia bacterium]|nr:ABC transporter ATP-binding protein [Tissierellia bacterium]
MSQKNLVTFKNLKTSFHTDQGVVRAVRGVSFDIPYQSTVALVGESGSGKSVTALSLMGLLPKPQGKIEGGQIFFEGEDVLAYSKDQIRQLRGTDLAMIFQEPMTSLNPGLKVGYQVAEVFYRVLGQDKKTSRKKAIDMLRRVELPRPEDLARSYPHELSGGQRQRVMIAMALASSPKLLIADEPTTALDVTIQAEVLDLMRRLQEDTGSSILLITHDLGVVAEMADYVVVMYGGRVVEKAPVMDLFDRPLHPYTQGLLRARPRLGQSGQKLFNIPGGVPDPRSLGGQCDFYDRCAYGQAICQEGEPQLVEAYPGHQVACFMSKEGKAPWDQSSCK